MKQLNLPRKYTLASQLFISVALIILAAIFAFTPILTIDLSDNKARETLNDVLDSFSESIDAEDAEFEIPEKVNVSMPKLVTSVGVFTKIIGVVIDGAGSAIDGDEEGANEATEDLNKVLASEEGQETIVMLMGLMMGTLDTDSFESSDAEESEDSTVGAVVNGIISYGILFYLLAISLVWPIVLIVTAIITLIKALKAWKKGENVASKFGAGLIGALGTVVTVALLMTFVPNMVLGFGMVAILVLSIISIVVNVVVSRLRSYNDVDFKYANVVQGTALVKLVGFIVFFTSVLKTGFLRSFIDSVSEYLSKALKQVADINKSIDAANKLSSTKVDNLTMNFGYLIELALMLVAAALALSVCVSVAKSVAAQLGLVAKKKVATPGSLASGIIALIVCIIPVVVSKLENKIFYSLKIGNKLEVVEEKAGSIFKISSDSKSALVGMFIGAVLILASGIAYLVTKNVFCKDMTAEQQSLVLSGNAPLVGAAEEAPAEEAPAEEAPAEEAPAEEAPAEEAPAEAAPAEEAPAEAAPAEEAPAEEAPAEE